MPNTPIQGLAIPQGLSTPGGLNITAGTYPFMWAGNLAIIDNFYSPANAVPSGTGLIITANLNMLGFGIANASTLALSSTLTVGGASTLTGGVVSPLLIGAGLANSITLTAKAPGTDPTITVAGDANRGLLMTLTGNGLFQITNGNGLTMSIGQTSGDANSIGLWPTAAGGVTNSNYTLYGILTSGRLNGSTDSRLQVGGADIVTATSSSVAINGVPIQQSAAATALTLKGNAAATGSSGGVVLDGSQSGTQTSGTTLSVQNHGAVIATVDFAGSIISASGNFSTTTASTGLTLTGNAAATGTGLTVNNMAMTGTGLILALKNSGAGVFAVSALGHLIPQTPAPAPPLAGVFAAGYQAAGAVNTISLTGSDASMLLKFTTGTTTAQITEMTSLIGTVTLNQGYNNTNYNIIAAYASEPTNASLAYGSNDTAPLIGVPITGSTFALYAAIPFTPKINQAYAISIITMGAGATS